MKRAPSVAWQEWEELVWRRFPVSITLAPGWYRNLESTELAVVVRNHRKLAIDVADVIVRGRDARVLDPPLPQATAPGGSITVAAAVDADALWCRVTARVRVGRGRLVRRSFGVWGRPVIAALAPRPLPTLQAR